MAEDESLNKAELVVIQDIQHLEPAATIPPEEASWTATELSTSLIQWSLQCSSDHAPESFAGDSAAATEGLVDTEGIATLERPFSEVWENDGKFESLRVEPELLKEEVKLCMNASVEMLNEGQPMVNESVAQTVVGMGPDMEDHNTQPLPISEVCLAVPSSPSDPDIVEFPQLMLLIFSRHPKSFEDVLLSGVDLQQSRDALQHEGHPCRLPCGTKIFVSPSEYKCAMMAICERRLGPSFVIVSTALEPLVMSAIGKPPHKERVRVKDRQPLAYNMDLADGILTVARTFLCTVRPGSQDAVTSSSTQVHHRPRNPRAVSSAL